MAPLIPLLCLLLVSACAPAPLHIAPAREGMAGKEIASLELVSSPVLDGHAMGLRKVDGVQVSSHQRVRLSPGWHFFEYGYRKHAGCRRYKHTQAYVDYGVGVLRDPSRDRYTCLEPVFEDHAYSGWSLLEGGRRYRWPDLLPLLKESPDSGGPRFHEGSVRGVMYGR